MAEEPGSPQVGAGTAPAGAESVSQPAGTAEPVQPSLESTAAPVAQPATTAAGQPAAEPTAPAAPVGDLTMDQMLDRSEAENSQMRALLEDPAVMQALDMVRQQQGAAAQPAAAAPVAGGPGLDFTNMDMNQAFGAYHQMVGQQLPAYVRQIVGEVIKAQVQPTLTQVQGWQKTLTGRVARGELTTQLDAANRTYANLGQHKEDLVKTLEQYPGMDVSTACRVLGLEKKAVAPPAMPGAQPAGPVGDGLQRAEPLQPGEEPVMGEDSVIQNHVMDYFKQFGPPP